METTALLERLEELTKKMDVPVFRRRKPFWLLRNLSIRNKDHPNFPEAVDIAKILAKKGVRN